MRIILSQKDSILSPFHLYTRVFLASSKIQLRKIKYADFSNIKINVAIRILFPNRMCSAVLSKPNRLLKIQDVSVANSLIGLGVFVGSLGLNKLFWIEMIGMKFFLETDDKN